MSSKCATSLWLSPGFSSTARSTVLMDVVRCHPFRLRTFPPKRAPRHPKRRRAPPVASNPLCTGVVKSILARYLGLQGCAALGYTTRPRRAPRGAPAAPQSQVLVCTWQKMAEEVTAKAGRRAHATALRQPPDSPSALPPSKTAFWMGRVVFYAPGSPRVFETASLHVAVTSASFGGRGLLPPSEPSAEGRRAASARDLARVNFLRVRAPHFL